MSTNLYYRLPADEHELSHRLKLATEEKYFRNSSGWVVLDSEDINFFEGIAAASESPETRKGAKEIIELIETHGSIEMCIHG